MIRNFYTAVRETDKTVGNWKRQQSLSFSPNTIYKYSMAVLIDKFIHVSS